MTGPQPISMTRTSSCSSITSASWVPDEGDGDLFLGQFTPMSDSESLREALDEYDAPLTVHSPTLLSASIVQLPVLPLPMASSPTARQLAKDIPRHPRYYLDDGTVTLIVDGTLFKVHRFFLERDSEVCRKIFNKQQRGEDGKTDATAIHLYGPSRDEFEGLLDFFYNGMYTDSLPKSESQWIDLLSISTLLEFTRIRKRAILELNSGYQIDPVEKIVLARDFKIPEWRKSAYEALVQRVDGPSHSEAERMGLKTTVSLYLAREAVRKGDGARSGIQADNQSPFSPLRVSSIVDDIFSNPASFAMGPEQPELPSSHTMKEGRNELKESNKARRQKEMIAQRRIEEANGMQNVSEADWDKRSQLEEKKEVFVESPIEEKTSMENERVVQNNKPAEWRSQSEDEEHQQTQKAEKENKMEKETTSSQMGWTEAQESKDKEKDAEKQGWPVGEAETNSGETSREGALSMPLCVEQRDQVCGNELDKAPDDDEAENIDLGGKTAMSNRKAISKKAKMKLAKVKLAKRKAKGPTMTMEEFTGEKELSFSNGERETTNAEGNTTKHV